MKYCYLNLTTMVVKLYHITGLNPTLIIANNVSLNGYDSGLAEINCGVPQSSVLAVPLFLLYINQAIKFGEVYHISDHTNLLYLGRSIKKLNKVVNLDLKTMLYWLSANKILLILKKLN